MSRTATFLVVVLAMAIATGPTAAQSPIPAPDAEILGIYLSGKTGQETLNRFVYKSERLSAANEVYDRDRAAAAGMIRAQDPSFAVSEKELPRNQFLEEYGKRIDRDMAGLRLGDSPLGKVASIALAYGAALATQGRAGGAQAAAGASASILGSKLDELVLRNPISVPNVDEKLAYEYGRAIQREIDSGSALGLELKKGLREQLGVASVGGLRASPEVQQRLLLQKDLLDAAQDGKLHEYVTQRFQEVAEKLEQHDLRSREEFARAASAEERQQKAEEIRRQNAALIAQIRAAGAGLSQCSGLRTYGAIWKFAKNSPLEPI